MWIELSGEWWWGRQLRDCFAAVDLAGQRCSLYIQSDERVDSVDHVTPPLAVPNHDEHRSHVHVTKVPADVQCAMGEAANVEAACEEEQQAVVHE
jgi:hypothetical protein